MSLFDLEAWTQHPVVGGLASAVRNRLEAAVVAATPPSGWTRVERAFCESLFAALVPEVRTTPGLGSLDLDAFFRRYAEVAPPMLRFGLRASIDFLALSPPLLLGVPRTVLGLSEVDRERLLQRAAHSPFFLVRQVMTTVKLVGLMAYLHDDAVRTRIGGSP